MTNENQYDAETDGFEDAFEPGYADFDWDTLDAKERELHDSILEMSREELLALDTSKLNDLALWAAAQAFADIDEDDSLFPHFEKICFRIIESRESHPAIDYGGIGLELLNTFMAFERFADARTLLQKVVRHIPADSFIEERYSALISILEGDEDNGFTKIQQLIDKAEEMGDGYLLYAIAEDLITITALEDAEAVLEKVEEIAGNEKDDELAALVEDARATIEQMYAEEEEEEA